MTLRPFGRTFHSVLLACLLTTMAIRVSGQVPAVALTGATIYPAPDRPPIRDGVVIVRDGRIEAVGPRASLAVPKGTTVLGLSGLVLTAGFWNSHVHFSGPQWSGAAGAPSAGLAESLRDMLLRWGFTTVFDTGSPLQNTLALRRRIDTGSVEGPTIFTAGDILYPAGVPQGRFRLQTTDEAVAASRTVLDEGADAVKVYAQAFWDLKLKLPPEAMAAVVAEAHARKKPVLAHPSNRDGLDNAVNAGVDVLVHTTPQIGAWGPERVAKMKAAGIALVPTLKLWRFELLREKVPEPRIEAFQRQGVEQLREYFSAGGPILFGTDVGYMTDFSTLEEFQQMAQAGMGPRDILASLTTVPSARQGLGGRSGRVEAGFDADFVVLRGDPLQDIGAFADVAYTIKRGRVIYRAPAPAAVQSCFLLAELGGRELRRDPSEACRTRMTPASTFKVPHALAALDAGVVKGLDEVMRYDSRTAQAEWPDAWKHDHTLATAMRDSVVWFFQRMAERLGPDREASYLGKLAFGNMDSTSGLTTFWLGGSLLVSPEEQLAFWARLYRDELPVAPSAVKAVKQTLIQPPGFVVNATGRHAFAGPWPATTIVSAKTGRALDRSGRGARWLAGHISRDGRQYVFVSLVTGAPDLAQNAAVDLAARALREARLLP